MKYRKLFSIDGQPKSMQFRRHHDKQSNSFKLITFSLLKSREGRIHYDNLL